MPRQLFFRHPKIRRFSADDDRVRPAMGSMGRLKRPDHVSKIGLCLTYWPDVDMQLALLLAALTRAEAAPIVAVYSVIRHATGRHEAIKAAASVSLDFRGQSIISSILGYAKSIEGERNDLAHGYWGICELLPDCILWISGQNAIGSHVLKSDIHAVG
jgi:hypothetical protein